MNPVNAETNKTIKNCFNCNKSSPNLYACMSCKIAYYCGRECQKSNWPKHREFCRINSSEKKEASIARIAKSVSVLPQENSPIKQLESSFLSLKNQWDSQLSKTVQKLDWQTQAKKESQNTQIYLKLPKTNKKEIVVDLGSGSGKYALHALEQGYQTIAIDSFLGFNNAMAPHKKKYTDQLHLIEGDLFNYKFPESASYILAIQTFQYCPPYKLVQLFRSVYESLDESGYFFFTLWSQKKASADDLRYIQSVGAWSIPNFELVTKALEQMGFEVKTIEQGEASPLIIFQCTKKP